MNVAYHKKFRKRYRALSHQVKAQFEERIDLFVENPTHPILNNHSVEKAYPGCRSINITGDYRALFREDDDIVWFMRIGTHAELYG